MLCLNCRKNEAIISLTYGVLPCGECQARQGKLTRPQRQVEFTTEGVRSQRKEYASDIVQPFRGGELSKEYVSKYGTKGLKGVSKREVKRAKRVWSDSQYYKE